MQFHQVIGQWCPIIHEWNTVSIQSGPMPQRMMWKTNLIKSEGSVDLFACNVLANSDFLALVMARKNLRRLTLFLLLIERPETTLQHQVRIRNGIRRQRQYVSYLCNRTGEQVIKIPATKKDLHVHALVFIDSCRHGLHSRPDQCDGTMWKEKNAWNGEDSRVETTGACRHVSALSQRHIHECPLHLFFLPSWQDGCWP